MEIVGLKGEVGPCASICYARIMKHDGRRRPTAINTQMPLYSEVLQNKTQKFSSLIFQRQRLHVQSIICLRICLYIHAGAKRPLILSQFEQLIGLIRSSVTLRCTLDTIAMMLQYSSVGAL